MEEGEGGWEGGRDRGERERSGEGGVETRRSGQWGVNISAIARLVPLRNAHATAKS